MIVTIKFDREGKSRQVIRLDTDVFKGDPRKLAYDLFGDRVKSVVVS